MNSYRTRKTAARINSADEYRELPQLPEELSQLPGDLSSKATRGGDPGRLLSIGAKTLAGVGLGLVTVLAGAAVLGLAAEVVLVPTLVVKLAGAMAGGGVGMAKGLKDEGKRP